MSLKDSSAINSNRFSLDQGFHDQKTQNFNARKDRMIKGIQVADISLENTAAASGFHRRVVVRDSKGNAQYGFSFGMNDNSSPFRHSVSNNGEPARGKAGNGEVYPDMRDPATKTVDTFKTTPEEDRAVADYMKSRKGETAEYNLIRNNCRGFSASEFEGIKSEILRARAGKRPPKFD